ncbi:MAG: SlyX family protein [Aureliella sp.]
MDEQQSLAKRITELEFQLAHHQRLCEQLNEVVVGHTQQLLRMERAMARLEEQLKLVREQRKEAFDPGIEKPPHY